MAKTLKINRSVETVEVLDEDGAVALSWDVKTDDESVYRTLHMLGDAMDRFHAISSDIAAAETDEERERAVGAMVRLFKRSLTAIIGEDGWHEVLAHIGGGEECDPAKNINNLGDVFAMLVQWYWDRCSLRQLRAAGAYFDRERAAAPANRQQRRAAKKSKKKAK